MLRTRHGVCAYALDLEPVGTLYRDHDYYRVEDATATGFPDESVRGISSQCAFEMFLGDDDVRFVREVARILEPGGKAIILPLYLHTHYCAYATPDCFGLGFADPRATEYIVFGGYGIKSSRKYDADNFASRIAASATESGLLCRVLVLRNKEQIGEAIYCHFILELSK